jgi:hypothetical protein
VPASKRPSTVPSDVFQQRAPRRRTQKRGDTATAGRNLQAAIQSRARPLSKIRLAHARPAPPRTGPALPPSLPIYLPIEDHLLETTPQRLIYLQLDHRPNNALFATLLSRDEVTSFPLEKTAAVLSQAREY